MRVIADLHIHSRFARACSKELTVPNLAKWARIKGVQLLSTGDFTHPAWFSELREHLEPIPDEPGLYRARGVDEPTRFVCGTEVACIYSHLGQTRRLHLCLFAPSLEIVAEINRRLEARGCNIRSDGRPILGLSAQELLKILLDVDQRNVMIPAHAWTPWFAVFGSKSGYDSLEECFGELTSHIFSIETGLSSDPPMNWRLSALDKITLVSNSDAHSLPNLGREANVFDLPKVSYDALFNAIRAGNPAEFLYTLEFYPEEGMYHYDGHRACQVRLTPAQTKRAKGICPKCKKPLTVGVLNRVEALADQPEGREKPRAIPFKRLVELDKVIAEGLGIATRSSKKVQEAYWQLIERFGSELGILLDVDLTELVETPRRGVSTMVAEGVRRVRSGELRVEPGYDGEYGEVHIFSREEVESGKPKQGAMF